MLRLFFRCPKKDFKPFVELGILSFAELLKMLVPGEQKNDEFIKMFELSDQRMLNIINDIVDIVKNEDGEIQMHFNLTTLIKNALKFTSAGSIEFGYSLSGKMLVFYRKDSRIGIQPIQKK